MHPVLHLEFAKARAADWQRNAERQRMAQTTRRGREDRDWHRGGCSDARRSAGQPALPRQADLVAPPPTVESAAMTCDQAG
jgi:hypothetical protein